VTGTVRRAVRRGSAVAVLALALVGTGAAPAFAHAVIQSSDPPQGAAFDTSPKTVTLRFSESVEASLGAVRVYDQRGHRIDTTRPVHPGGGSSVVQVSLPSLRNGSYVVTWRVTSADAHPVRGAFTFRVGPSASGANVSGLATRLLSSAGGSRVVGALLAAARFAIFAALALLVGGAGFLVLAWSAGRFSHPAVRLVWVGWVALLGSTAIAFALQGPYAAALPLRDMLRPGVLADVWHTRYGHVAVLRLALLVLAVPLLRMLLPPRGRPPSEYPLPSWWPAVGALVGAGLVLTPGLAGHASTGSWVPFALASDAVHVGAMSLWLGGLVMLLMVLFPRRELYELSTAVPRFSRIALLSVSALVATGAYQTWRQVGSLHAAVTTDYGGILVLKLLGFVALVVLGAFSREVVNRRYLEPAEVVWFGVGAAAAEDGGGANPPDDYRLDDYRLDEETAVHRLKRTVGAEVVLAVIVLTLTALLVNTAPARGLEQGAFVGTLKSSKVWFDVVVTPVRAGANELHLTAVSPTGGIADPPSVGVELSQPSRGIAPIKVTLRRLGPGHYVSAGLQIPFPGDWQLAIKALASETDEVTARKTIAVR